MVSLLGHVPILPSTIPSQYPTSYPLDCICRQVKASDKLAFPLALNMGTLLEAAPPDPLNLGCTQAGGGPAGTYDLVAILVHKGSSAGHGHYGKALAEGFVCFVVGNAQVTAAVRGLGVQWVRWVWQTPCVAQARDCR